MVIERNVDVGDGRVVRAYDTGGTGTGGTGTSSTGNAPAVLWHHGSPHTGVPLPPLLSAAAEHGVRLVTYARPGYGGSTRSPGRDVASAADDVARVADAVGLDRFAVLGSSGGGPHALACAALLRGRVAAAACLAGLAPFTDAFDWYAGMASDGALRSATGGPQARARYGETEEFDPAVFTDADWTALSGAWRSLGEDAGRAGDAGQDGLVDDDVAFVRPWGFDPAQIAAPVLLVHGQHDRMVPPAHAEQLARQIPGAEVWRRPDDGHVSVLDAVPDALDWLRARF